MELFSETFDKRAYRYLLGLTVLTLITGTVVYHLIEHFSWLNSYYFSVITLTTVGYGDLTPHTAFGKLFTTFYVFVGVGIITTFISTSMHRRQARRAERHHRQSERTDT